MFQQMPPFLGHSALKGCQHWSHMQEEPKPATCHFQKMPLAEVCGSNHMCVFLQKKHVDQIQIF